MSEKTPTGITVAVIASFAIAGVGVFATCGGCKKSEPSSSPAESPAAAAVESVTPKAAGARAPAHDPLLWANAKDGDPEDLATLATHEGPMGLVEAAADPERRATALRAMAHARGFSHVPFLARVAKGENKEEAALALDALVDLAARPRTSEEPEDAEELEEGCRALASLANDARADRTRRVPAIRALRMLPCPKLEIATDLDSK